MKATVDKEGCIACGLCVSMCPEVFSWDPDGTAQGSEIPPEQVSRAKDARDGCPVSVIDIK